MLLDQYRVIEKIDVGGGQADLYLCEDAEESGTRVVVKIYWGEIRPDRNILEDLKGIRHEDIISFLACGTVNDRFFEVMEYAEGGSLEERMRENPFGEEELTSIVIPEVINGLQYCHANGIIHRDIKEGNLYYRNADGTDVVIGDFGISSVLRGGESVRFTQRCWGTFDYLAPEAYPFFSGPGESAVGKEMDYYALGITLIKLAGVDPFLGIPETNRQFQIKMRNAVPLPERISDRFATLLRGLLHPDPTMRWGADEIMRWLAGEKVSLAPTSGFSLSGSEYKIGDEIPTTLEELAAVMLDHPREAMEDMGRGPLQKGVDSFDVNVGRAIARILDKPDSMENKFVEIVYMLDPSLPYRLMPGRDAGSPEELAAIIDGSDEAWNEGIAQLYDGRIPTWLRTIGETARWEAWNSCRSEFNTLQNAGLEAFLQILDPDIGSPSIELSESSVQVDCSTDRPRKLVTITVSNPGRGHLYGSVKLEGDGGVVDLVRTKIDVGMHSERSAEINLDIDMSGQDRGKTYRSRLVFNTNAGTAEIPIRCRTVFPSLSVLGTSSLFAAIGAFIGFAIRGFLHVAGRTEWLTSYFGHYIDFSEASSGRGVFFRDLNVFAVPFYVLLAVLMLRGYAKSRNS